MALVDDVLTINGKFKNSMCLVDLREIKMAVNVRFDF